MLFTPGSLSAGERVGWLYHPIVLGVSGGLALAGSLAVFAGLALRGSRERQARSQVAASRTQAIGAGLWIVAAIAFTIWLLLSADPAQLVFHWPSPWLLAASWLALAAAVLSLFMAFQLPGVWRGERRVAGWTGWRKLRHTITVLVYLVFGVLLAGWGALQPWTG